MRVIFHLGQVQPSSDLFTSDGASLAAWRRKFNLLAKIKSTKIATMGKNSAFARNSDIVVGVVVGVVVSVVVGVVVVGGVVVGVGVKIFRDLGTDKRGKRVSRATEKS